MNRRDFLRSLAVSAAVVAAGGSLAALARQSPAPGTLTREAFDRFLAEVMERNAEPQQIWYMCHPGTKAALVKAGIPSHFISCYQRPP